MGFFDIKATSSSSALPSRTPKGLARGWGWPDRMASNTANRPSLISAGRSEGLFFDGLHTRGKTETLEQRDGGQTVPCYKGRLLHEGRGGVCE